MGRKSALLLLFAAALAVVAVAGGGLGTKSASAKSWYDQLPTIQKRILSGYAAFEMGPNIRRVPTLSNGGDEDEGGDDVDVTMSPLQKRPTCPQNYGSNVVVNQNCLNISDPDLQGRGQAQNETAIASDPNNRRHVIASYNDYRRGDGTCGVSYSSDGDKVAGSHWKDATTPNGFTRGTAFDKGARQYWQASGDTSVAWDSRGNAYMLCQVFNRGGAVSNNPDQSSGLYLYRSTGSNGASWNFPGRPVAENNDVEGAGDALLDKPYMTVDASQKSPFRDRIYVTWTFFAPDQTGYIYEAYSDDYGETFSTPVVVNSDSDLCPVDYGLPTPFGRCNENQGSDPFTGPDGSLYVIYGNFNNAVKGNENWNQILISKSTDGGKTFGDPVLATKFYDLPDCATYQDGQDPGRACVPEKGSQQNSVFRAENWAPSGAVDPTNPNRVAVVVGSYINMHSNESNGCTPAGLAGDGQDLYDGVKNGGCNNDVLVSVSNDAGKTFTGTTTDPRKLTTATPTKAQGMSDQWWPWATFTDGGKLAVSYFDRQYGSDETTGEMDVTVAASSNAKTFGTARATSSSMPLPTQFPNAEGNSQFFGDYIGVTISEGRAFPVWPDTRNDDLFLCDGTGKKGVPPQLCNGTEPNGLKANDQQIYVAGVDLP